MEAFDVIEDHQFGGPPAIFHYVNVGPGVQDSEVITDVYLPLKERE